MVYSKKGNIEKAIEYFRKAFESRKNLFEGNHPDTANSLYYLGKGYYKLGQYKHALRSSLDALTMRKEVFPRQHFEIAQSLFLIGLIYEKLGNKKAQDHFKQSQEMREALLKENPILQNKNRRLSRLRLPLTPTSTYQGISVENKSPTNPIDNPANWDSEKVKKWFNDNKINSKIYESLSQKITSGKALQDCYQISLNNEPEFKQIFSNGAENQVEGTDLDHFKDSLKKLFT